MARFLVLYLIGITALQAGVCLAQPDPCLPSHHITLVNQTFRSAGNNLSFNSMVGDGDFNNTWLRFDSPAGGDLITWCLPIGSCGTYFPVWMDGTVPTISEGVVTRTAHAHWFQGCKDRPANISVKNCGNFRVYQLPNTTGNGMGYCVGNETRCPPGQTSATGWSPGCYPIPPKLVGTVMESPNPADDASDPALENLEVIVVGTAGGVLIAIAVAVISYQTYKRRRTKDAKSKYMQKEEETDHYEYPIGHFPENPGRDYPVCMTKNQAYEPKVPGTRNKAYVSNKKPKGRGTDGVYDEVHQNRHHGRPLPEPNTYTDLEVKGMADRQYCAVPDQHWGTKNML